MSTVRRSSILPDANYQFTRLAPGTHVVSLSTLPSNCRAEGATTRSITLVSRQLAPVVFVVSCVAVTAVLVVDVATSGEDRDLDGFAIQIDDNFATPVASNNRVLVYPLPLTAGSHTVRFGGVAPNCVLAEPAAIEIEVRAGGTTRDTTRLSYRIQCARLWQMAFTRSGQVRFATSDFSQQTFIGAGDHAGLVAPR